MASPTAFLVALLSAAVLAACDGSLPASPSLTSPNVTSTVALSNTSVVGVSVQEASAQAFVLFDGSLAQLNAPSATFHSGGSGPTGTKVTTINWSMPCREGGTKNISGTITVTRSNGSGTVSSDLLVSFTNCDVGKVILQGNPGITLVGQTAFQDGIPDTHTFHKGGGLIFTVPSGEQGSVTYDCTVTWDRQTGVKSATGTVSWEFPIGTPVSGPGCGGS